MDDGTYTEQLVGYDFWSHVVIAYYGGHSYEVSDAEASSLAAAGYGADVTGSYLASYQGAYT